MTEPASSMTKSNRYRFTCPTTGRVEFYLRCHLRRHLKWRGEQKKIEGDCATCMTAGKCAALAMMDIERRSKKAVFYDEKGETVHRLPREVMAEIERVQIRTFHGERTTITPAELAALVDGTVENAAPPPPPLKRASKAPAPAKPADGDLSSIVGAAATNMAEAINAAVAISQG